MEWMEDLDAFQEALQAEKSYMGSLAQSMALMLEEFYKSLKAVGVSAITGAGMETFFAAVDAAAADYESTYAVELQKGREKRARRDRKKAAVMRAKLEKDTGGLEAAGATVVMGTESKPGAGDTAGDAAAAARAKARAGAAASGAGSAGGFPYADDGRKVRFEAGTRGVTMEGDDDDDDDEEEVEMYVGGESDDEDDEEDDLFDGGAYTGRAGFTYADEKWAQENPQEDREELASLKRYLDARKATEQGGAAGASSGGGGGGDGGTDAEMAALLKEQAAFNQGLEGGKRPAATSQRVNSFPAVKPSGSSKPTQYP